MRKFLSVLLVIMLVVSLAACANNNTPDDTNKPTSTNSEEQASTNNETPTSSSNETKENVKTAQIPGREIYVDYSTSMRKKDQGNTVLMYKSNDCLVGLSYQKTGFTGTLNDVVDLFKNSFINDAANSSRGDLYGSEISISSSQKTTMANRESIKFTGTVRNEDSWDCHVYGYAFIIDNIPCAVIGLVSAQAQDASMISEIDAHVEEIASTIRTTK